MRPVGTAVVVPKRPGTGVGVGVDKESGAKEMEGIDEETDATDERVAAGEGNSGIEEGVKGG